MYLMINDNKIKIRNANTFLKRLIGLLGEKNIEYGMLFPHTKSIHTFFMKANIDVLALDENNEVILKCEDVPKNKIITAYNSAKKTSILELPSNTSKKIKIGDKLSFVRE